MTRRRLLTVRLLSPFVGAQAAERECSESHDVSASEYEILMVFIKTAAARGGRGIYNNNNNNRGYL